MIEDTGEFPTAPIDIPRQLRDEVPGIEMHQDEVRSRLRERAQRSTYFMAKAVMGFRDIVPGLHGDMCRFIENPSNRKLGLVPRDHLKTSIWTIADSIRCIAADPNIRILLGNETATNASHFLRLIEATFERNAVFRWLFWDIIPDLGAKKSKWSETEMIVKRTQDFPEATVEAIGVGGAVVSRHYRLIKLDDLVGKEASESQDVMKKTIDWYIYCESLLVDPNDPIHVFGTRWAYNDLYAHIKKTEEGIHEFFRQAIRPDNTTIWPERFNIETMLRLKRKYGTFKFSCQYQNDPKDPEATSFDENWLRFYNFRQDSVVSENGVTSCNLDKLRKFMLVDPAISEKAGAARTAIIVLGVAPDGKVFILEAWAKRCQPLEMFDVIFNLHARWNVDSCAVESVAYQKAIKPFLIAEALRRNVWLHVVEVKPDSKVRKENRIRGLQPYFERGEIHVLRSQSELLQEYVEFPIGNTVDLLDALAYGPQIWEVPELADGADEYDEWSDRGMSQLTGRSAYTGY